MCGEADTDRLLVGQRGALGRGAVEIILGKYGYSIGLKGTPHMFRHSLACQLIKSVFVMTTIQQILRRAS